MKKICFALIGLMFVFGGVTKTKETPVIAEEVVEVSTENIDVLPTNDKNCEYIPKGISIWNVKLFDTDGTEFKDVTTDKDRADGRRRMVAETKDGYKGILISEDTRLVTHFAVAEKSF